MSSYLRLTIALQMLLVFAASSACKDDVLIVEEGVTGFTITVAYDAVALDQLRVAGTQAPSGVLILGPSEIPETPRAFSATSESLVIVVDPELGGTAIDLRIDGLQNGSIQATAVQRVTVQTGRLMDVDIILGAPAVCGDGTIRSGIEVCDDENVEDGDGCSANCIVEIGFECTTPSEGPSLCVRICGNSRLDTGETCDDGNSSSGDGCTANCSEEFGFTCTTVGSPCLSTCGDGLKASDEDCDDGATLPGDGCSSLCELESGLWTCTGIQPSCCQRCGDGDIQCTETCDDGDRDNGDGCNSICLVEQGYSCTNEPSDCYKCGNSVLDPSEDCDDGNENGGDGCSSDCAEEDAFNCDTSSTPNTCYPCGDGEISIVVEGCDDGNLDGGDGCSADCVVESGWNCTSAEPSACFECGNGTLETAVEEECDDGARAAGDGCDDDCKTEAGWTCDDASPTCCSNCGNAKIECTELCDGPATNGLSCHYYGKINGFSELCDSCSSFEPSNCGPEIDSLARIRTAVTEAYAHEGSETVRIHEGEYQLASESIVLDECDPQCPDGGPWGLRLSPYDGGVVRFVATSSLPVLDIRSPSNTVEFIEFRDGGNAVHADDQSDVTVVSHCLFYNTDLAPPDTLVKIEGNRSIVWANAFWFDPVGSRPKAGVPVEIDSASNSVISQNVIVGNFDTGIYVHHTSSRTWVDHNTIIVTKDGTGAELDNVAVACVRANINMGTDGGTNSKGWNLNATTVGGDLECDGGIGSQSNQLTLHQTDCVGDEALCALYCDGGVTPLCDTRQITGIKYIDACLDGGSNLVDSAPDLLLPFYDFDDSTPDIFDYVGSAPDIGARESGTTRRYGGIISPCPF